MTGETRWLSSDSDRKNQWLKPEWIHVLILRIWKEGVNAPGRVPCNKNNGANVTGLPGSPNGTPHP
jgi:hypothetical protein